MMSATMSVEALLQFVIDLITHITDNLEHSDIMKCADVYTEDYSLEHMIHKASLNSYSEIVYLSTKHKTEDTQFEFAKLLSAFLLMRHAYGALTKQNNA